ncbi:hypothetical protein CLTEP_15590 [Clostridium tepidiprofundi DSM 19306]|uniref:Holin n=1 Tax=Clostridium tepidiprofundi DSM 19306 TaxID=1121338 RepID=A0A151B3Z1_9CLOT|nr:hypothetical protein [Clostridium tepidiprofundi]KYH34510.1 hypothetical protein CLTEP_15590 [Clostridium tepidiprofundi DSM 19306]
MNFNYKGIALIPIVTLIVNIIKKAGVPSKFAPLVSLIIGLIFGILFLADSDVKQGILLGIIIGISASGLYSNGKELTRNISRKSN